MKLQRCLLPVLIASIFLSTNLHASAEENDNNLLVSAVAQLSAAVEHLSMVMDKESNLKKDDDALRKLDIAISYLNFRSRRIEAVEKDIQQARTMKDRVEDFLTQMEQREKAFQDKARNDPSLSQEEIKQQQEDNSYKIQMMRDRMSSLDTEIIQHENKIAELQAQLNEIEKFVSENIMFKH